MPYTPIYAPRGNTLRSVDPDKPSSTFDILAFSATALGEGSDLHKIVLRWARTLATGGDVGGSIRGFCAVARISERTFHNRRARGVAIITAAKIAADATRLAK